MPEIRIPVGAIIRNPKVLIPFAVFIVAIVVVEFAMMKSWENPAPDIDGVFYENVAEERLMEAIK